MCCERPLSRERLVDEMSARGPAPSRMRRPPRARRASDYQLALTTPGSSPLCAISRKQIRQMPNLRKKARERPQRLQRLYWRTEYFGVRFAFAMSALRAKIVLLS